MIDGIVACPNAFPRRACSATRFRTRQPLRSTREILFRRCCLHMPMLTPSDRKGRTKFP